MAADMTSLADQIRAKLDEQKARFVGDLVRRTIAGRAHLQSNYELSDLGACHRAIHIALDEHQPCEPPRQLLCNGCRRMRPCPTEQAISAALGIKEHLDGGAA